ncbi:MAG: hypothetical protein NZ742_06550 [Acidobacteria bacterium]|nr:hypothetical protein [Acidobacteriota bacterium]MDW7984545.1 hypothetical protein [Acidobacteriota bacterium]
MAVYGHQSWRTIGGVISLLGLVGCTGPAVTTQALLPARYLEAVRYRNVAVLPIAGPEGYALAAEIETRLKDLWVEGRPYFSVRAPESLPAQLPSDPGELARWARRFGVEGLYTGAVTVADVDDQSYTEQRRECVQWEEKKCVRYESFPVYCIERKATFVFIPRLIDVATGQVVYSRDIQGTAARRACPDRRETLPTPGELLRMARQRALDEFLTDVAPRYAVVRIPLMTDEEAVLDPVAQGLLKEGVRWARDGRLDRACESWRRAYERVPSAVPVLYNLGVCAEATGDLQQALTWFTRAARSGGDDRRVREALERVRRRLEAEAAVQP